MRRLFACFGITMTLAAAVIAQPPDDRPGRRGGEPGGPGGGPPQGVRSPLVMALDADRDGMISEEEIKNATTALLSLDMNGDGKLTGEEFRPAGQGRAWDRVAWDRVTWGGGAQSRSRRWVRWSSQ